MTAISDTLPLVLAMTESELPINDQPQFQIGPIGVRVQHGPKVPPL